MADSLDATTLVLGDAAPAVATATSETATPVSSHKESRETPLFRVPRSDGSIDDGFWITEWDGIRYTMASSTEGVGVIKKCVPIKSIIALNHDRAPFKRNFVKLPHGRQIFRIPLMFASCSAEISGVARGFVVVDDDGTLQMWAGRNLRTAVMMDALTVEALEAPATGTHDGTSLDVLLMPIVASLDDDVRIEGIRTLRTVRQWMLGEGKSGVITVVPR